MLKRMKIQNFRGFNELIIDDLTGINLIAGKNNAGKTSLLEAVFLLGGAGNAQLALNSNIIRSTDGSGIQEGDPLWKHLFFELDLSTSIEIEGEDITKNRMKLEVTSDREENTEIPYDRSEEISVLDNYNEHSLSFQFTSPDKKSTISQITRKSSGIEVKQPNVTIPFPMIILLSRVRNSREDATRLGNLRRRKQGDLLLKALQVIEPRLRSIEDNSSSGVPMIWGDVGLSELVPLSVMGEGMSHIARLVLAIASAPSGVVLIDEFENGLHHTILRDVWRVVDEAAVQFETQIFATTHSRECVVAAQNSLEQERFRLLRLESLDNSTRCVTYDPESIEAAVRHGLEVR